MQCGIPSGLTGKTGGIYDFLCQHGFAKIPWMVYSILQVSLVYSQGGKAMVVSMIQMIFEIPDVESIKDKRKIVRSVKDKLQRQFHMSAAEVDLQDSLSFAHIGGALVSNSRSFGESVLNKAFSMIEQEIPVRIQDVQIYSEEF